MEHFSKRNFLLRTLLPSMLVIFFAFNYLPVFANVQSSEPSPIQKKLAALEAQSGGRLGVFALDTANNMQIQYRADERFPMGSTAKVMGVAAVLKKAMSNHSLLQEKITYTKAELASVVWAPVTSKHLNTGMTIAELCGAAIMQSDTLAIKLLIKKINGSKTVNLFAKSIGDNQFRLGSLDPEEASAIPEDLRNTSTPRAMAKSLQKLILGNSLAAPQRELLESWLKRSTTGYLRIRAGVPKGWVVGDKTGTGTHGTTNDIAIIWPPNCSPIILATYFTQGKKNVALLAAATREVIKDFAQSDQCIKSAM